jgi:hypothetical protein
MDLAGPGDVYSKNAQRDCGSHLAYSWLLSGVHSPGGLKRTGLEFDQLSLSSTEVKNEWSFGVQRDNFTLT